MLSSVLHPNRHYGLSSPLPFSSLRAALKLVLAMLWTLLWLLPIFVALRLKLPSHSLMVCHWSKGMLRIIGVKIEKRGKRCKAKPVLYVSNHSSYLDILVLAAILPASLISKLEVADWPVIGLLGKLGRPVFIARDPRKTQENLAKIRENLAIRGRLALFPEGTTSDGNRVLPFKSSFFTLAEETLKDKPMTVQPMACVYTKFNGIRMGQAFRPHVAWYGQMSLGGHVWNLLKYRNITAEITYLDPIEGEMLKQRKKLATHCHHVIADAVEASVTGRGGDQ